MSKTETIASPISQITKSGSSTIEQLSQIVDELYQSHGMVMFKAGSEWENMDINEIAYLKQLGSYDIPILAKVGGLESRTEIRHLLNIGIDYLLAPMVESEFALKKFVTSTQEVCDAQQKKAKLAIMIESIETVKNMKAIFNSPHLEEIEMLVLGRLDLATSMGFSSVDNEEVEQLSKEIIARAVDAKLPISIGGFVNPKSAVTIKNTLNPSMLNTIHILFDLNKTKDIPKAIEMALQFEVAFYESLQNLNPKRADFYNHRIEITKRKMGI